MKLAARAKDRTPEMIPRYSRPEMVAIWEPQTRFRIWFEIEAHACDALAELGVIPREAAKTIWEKGGAAQFDVGKIDEIEAVTKHDVIAFLTHLTEFEFGEMGEEGDDVVLGDGLDLVDLADVELGGAAFFPDGFGGFPGNDAELGQRIAGMGLDLEPDAEA